MKSQVPWVARQVNRKYKKGINKGKRNSFSNLQIVSGKPSNDFWAQHTRKVPETRERIYLLTLERAIFRSHTGHSTVHLWNGQSININNLDHQMIENAKQFSFNS